MKCFPCETQLINFHCRSAKWTSKYYFSAEIHISKPNHPFPDKNAKNRRRHTLTQEAVTRSIFDRLDLSKTASAKAVEATFEIIKLTLMELEERFRPDDACIDYLRKLRWPNGFACPKCQAQEIWKTRREFFHCAKCGAQTSVTSGTILQGTRKSLPRRCCIQRVALSACRFLLPSRTRVI